MKKFEVLKSFFKLSEQKNYAVGDIIELNDEDSFNMLKYDLVKEVKKAKKND